MDRPFPAYQGDEPYIFVSYSHKDASAVFPELTRLKGQGFNIWYDEGIEAGTEWREEIGKAILNARVFLYFVSQEGVQSANCRKEVGLADKQQTPTIAIHLEYTELPAGLDLTLSDHQAILKYETPKEEYQQKLQARIASYLDQPVIQPVVVKRKKTVPIIAGIAGFVVLTIGLFFYNQQETETLPLTRSVTILPFTSIGMTAKSEAYAAGLTEEITGLVGTYQEIQTIYPLMTSGSGTSQGKASYQLKGSLQDNEGTS